MCVCMYVCMYVCAYVYVYVCVHICMHAYTCASVQIASVYGTCLRLSVYTLSAASGHFIVSPRDRALCNIPMTRFKTTPGQAS